MSDLSPTLAELERLYRALVYTDSDGEAVPLFPRFKDLRNTESPVITVSSKGRKRNVSAWYVPAVWGDSGEDTLAALAGGPATAVQTKRAEIVIASELLGNPDQAVAELARQMLVHAKRAKVSGNHYYPQGWEYWAGFIGCRAYILPDQPSKGWAGLEIGPVFQAKAVPLIDYSAFAVERQSDKPAKVGSRMHKWSCGCTTIRAAVLVKATCDKCKHPFRWAEDPGIARAKWSYPALEAALGPQNAPQGQKGVTA